MSRLLLLLFLCNHLPKVLGHLLHRLLFRFTLCDLGFSLLSVLGMSINLIVVILLVLGVFVVIWPQRI